MITKIELNRLAEKNVDDSLTSQEVRDLLETIDGLIDVANRKDEKCGLAAARIFELEKAIADARPWLERATKGAVPDDVLAALLRAGRNK